MAKYVKDYQVFNDKTKCTNYRPHNKYLMFYEGTGIYKNVFIYRIHTVEQTYPKVETFSVKSDKKKEYA